MFLLLILSSLYIVNSAPYEIENAFYTGFSLDTSNVTASARRIAFDANGSKLYHIDPSSDTIYQYNCSTNYKIDTCSYASLSLSVSAQDSSPRGLEWNDDGSRIFMIGASNDRVFEYSCSTNYKIDTCSYASRFFSVSSQESVPLAVRFNNDGSRAYISGSADIIFEYTCTTNYQANTCSYSGRSLNTATQDTSLQDFEWNNDGSKIFTVGGQNDNVYQYSCSTPYQINTCTYDSISFDVSTQDTNPFSLRFDDSGENFYVNGLVNTTIFQYTNTVSIQVEFNDIYPENDNVNFNLSSEQNTNMTYYLNGGNETFICNNCNNFSLNLSGLPNDLNEIIFSANTSGSVSNTTVQFYVNPLASFYFELSNGTQITDYSFGGRSDNGTGLVQSRYSGDLITIGSNSLLFESNGFQSMTYNFTVNTSLPLYNNTFIGTPAQLNINILDRETGNLVSGVNFTIELISQVGLVTSTNTGTKTISNALLLPGSYQLVISTPANYTTESIFFTFNNREELDLSIYTQDTTQDNYGVVEVKVVDKFGKAIQGSIAQALQWDSNTSSFIKVSEGLTAEDGKTILNIILDTKLYIFQASFGGLSKNTSQQFIPTLLNGKEIVISLDEGATIATGLFENIEYIITESFDNNTYTSNISFSWNNKEGTDVTGCIKYFRVQTSGTKTLLSEDCSTGSVVTDLQVSKLLNSSYYIFAEVGFEQGSSFYVLQTFKYNPLFDISNILKQTNLALYILPLLYLLSVFIGMLNPFTGGAGLIIVNLLGLYLVPQYLNGTVVAFMYFIGGLIMYAGGKRK